jgi:hypothetical protein
MMLEIRCFLTTCTIVMFQQRALSNGYRGNRFMKTADSNTQRTLYIGITFPDPPISDEKN